MAQDYSNVKEFPATKRSCARPDFFKLFQVKTGKHENNENKN